MCASPAQDQVTEPGDVIAAIRKTLDEIEHAGENAYSPGGLAVEFVDAIDSSFPEFDGALDRTLIALLEAAPGSPSEVATAVRGAWS
jgi:hypothetical protein